MNRSAEQEHRKGEIMGIFMGVELRLQNELSKDQLDALHGAIQDAVEAVQAQARSAEERYELAHEVGIGLAQALAGDSGIRQIGIDRLKVVEARLSEEEFRSVHYGDEEKVLASLREAKTK